MIDEKIKKESENFSDMCTGSYESTAWAERGFIAGANWALQNQWHDASNDLPCNHPELIEEDNPNYTHDVLCESEKGTLYVDYMFQSRISKEWKWSAENDCKRWMPIPNLHEKLK